MNERYQKLHLLQTTPHTDVWEGLDRENKSPIVIKTSKSKESKELIDQEAKLLLELRHPNIVQLVEHISEQYTSSIITKKVNGESLDYIIAKQVVSPGFALQIALDIISAIRSLHNSEAKTILHRDIKPGNIVYCKTENKAILIDFGISTLLGINGTCLSEVSGYTMPYTSPGLWTPTGDARVAVYNASKYSHQCDIFALGLTIYELIAGCSAYNLPNRSSEGHHAIIFNGEISPITVHGEFSEGIVGLFYRWLSSSPKDQFGNLDELENAVKNCPELAIPEIDIINLSNKSTIVEPKSNRDLFPTGFEVKNGIRAQKELLKSKRDKIEAIAKRNVNGHYMITGIPGSGKTYCIITRAIYLANKNPSWKVAIVCYNKKLQKHITKALKSLLRSGSICGEMITIDKSHIDVKTTTSIEADMLGYNFSDNMSWDEYHAKASERAVPKYDAILIDEYQDFDESLICFIKKICISKVSSDGIKHEQITLAGDPAQTIFSKKHSRENWERWGITTTGRERWLDETFRVSKLVFETCKNLFKDIYPPGCASKLERMFSNPLSQSGKILMVAGTKKITCSKIIEKLLHNRVSPQDILVVDTEFKNDSTQFREWFKKSFSKIRI
ncbi:MAG: protein kinase, partial [Bacteriovoracaceae bacterium]|nr:protein kinase [Bacteriovoracaceae bacterium]